MKSIISFRLIRRENGFVFLYVLMLMLFISTLLLMTLSHQYLQMEHLILAQEQMNIQNLIELSIVDFKDILTPVNESAEGMIQLNYQTGNVSIDYKLENERTYRLELSVETLRGTTYQDVVTVMNKSMEDSP